MKFEEVLQEPKGRRLKIIHHDRPQICSITKAHVDVGGQCFYCNREVEKVITHDDKQIVRLKTERSKRAVA